MPRQVDPKEKIAVVMAKFPLLDFTSSKYIGVEKPITFVCPKHGEQKVSMFNQLLKSPHGCPTCGKECAPSKPVPDPTWLSRLTQARPDFTFTLDVQPEEIAHLSKNSQRLKMTKVSAPCGHTWVTTCASIIDQKSGCNVCDKASHTYLNKARATRWAKYREAKAAGVDFSNSKFILASKRNIQKARLAKNTQTLENT